MSADQFAMEPAATLDGLSAAAGDRLGACAQGLPAIPAGTYTAAESIAATETNESTAATILSI